MVLINVVKIKTAVQVELMEHTQVLRLEVMDQVV